MSTPSPDFPDYRFEDPRVLALGLAERVAGLLQEGIRQRGTAGLIVSGGRSPVAFFERLSEQALDWSAVTISLADERWVPTDADESNEGLVRRHLLQEDAAEARFVGLYTGDATPEEGEAACAERLAALPRPLDAVVLGLGEDGHTASLFPGAQALMTALLGEGGPCQAIRADGIAEPRMTLTLSSLLDTRRVLLTFQGVAKRRAYEAALRPGSFEDRPVRAVIKQERAPVEVWWSPRTT